MILAGEVADGDRVVISSEGNVLTFSGKAPQTAEIVFFEAQISKRRLGTAFTGHLAGLSAPIGAFLTGMVVDESDFRHQVEDDIRPYRDVLLDVFFVTTGMEINPSTINAAPVAVLAWIIACVLGKPLSCCSSAAAKVPYVAIESDLIRFLHAILS